MRAYALNRRAIVNEPELRVQTTANHYPLGGSVNYGVTVLNWAEVIAKALVLHEPACPYSSHTDLKLQVGVIGPEGKAIAWPTIRIFNADIAGWQGGSFSRLPGLSSLSAGVLPLVLNSRPGVTNTCRWEIKGLVYQITP